MSYGRNKAITTSSSPLTPQSQIIAAYRLTIGHSLAEGSFGEVFQGTLDGKYPVAIKVLRTETAQEQASIEREIKTLSKLRELSAPNVIYYYGLQTLPYFAIIMEDGGCALNKVIENTKKPLGLTHRYKILEEISYAIHFLHGIDYVHRDIKTDNVLVGKDLQIKLCDFGFAVEKKANLYLRDRWGTLRWMAPEVLLGQGYNEKVDIYSLGIVLWEVMSWTSEEPYKWLSNEKVISHVLQGGRETLPTDCSPEMKQLITNCWHQIPANRPTATVAHSTLQSMRVANDAPKPEKKTLPTAYKKNFSLFSGLLFSTTPAKEPKTAKITPPPHRLSL